VCTGSTYWFSVAAPLAAEDLAAREGEMIERALAASRGRVSGASGAATIIPGSTLESRIMPLGIRKERFKSA